MPRSRYLLAACAVLALSTSACAQLDTLTGLSPATVTTVRLDTGKALALAYDGLDAAALAIETARTAGYFKTHASAEQAAGADLKKALAILDAARDAYNASGTDPSAAIASVVALVGQIKTLAGK